MDDGRSVRGRVRYADGGYAAERGEDSPGAGCLFMLVWLGAWAAALAWLARAFFGGGG